LESIQEIKIRIASIQSTRQITQSMRLVSTSKVQRARAAMENNAGFLTEAERLVRVAALSLDSPSHRYTKAPGKSAAVIIISGDRGLCGGYNVNVSKAARAVIGEYEDAKIITIGSKARDFFRRRGDVTPIMNYSGMSEAPIFADALDIARRVLELYDSGEVSAIELVSTKFYSMLRQEPERKRILPLAPTDESRIYGCEPGGDSYLEGTVPFYFAGVLYGAMLEAATCEQSARITSMDTAVRNADDMISEFTLRYNQARQSAITQEITEIVGGASAVQK